MATKVLLIDDHPLFCFGMEAALSAHHRELELTAVDSVKKAREVLTDQPDIAITLLDILLLGENGLLELPALRNDFPATPVIILTGVPQVEMVESAVASGAQGFISKSRHADEIVQAIHTVLDGGIAISMNAWETDTPSSTLTADAVPNPLTERLNSILSLIMMGQPNKQIARELGIAETTVRGYVSDILKALGAKNRTEAVAIARDKGWL